MGVFRYKVIKSIYKSSRTQKGLYSSFDLLGRPVKFSMAGTEFSGGNNSLA